MYLVLVYLDWNTSTHICILPIDVVVGWILVYNHKLLDKRGQNSIGALVNTWYIYIIFDLFFDMSLTFQVLTSLYSFEKNWPQEKLFQSSSKHTHWHTVYDLYNSN